LIAATQVAGIEGKSTPQTSRPQLVIDAPITAKDLKLIVSKSELNLEPSKELSPQVIGMDFVYTIQAKDEERVGDNLIDASILAASDMSMKPSNPRDDEDRFNFKVRRGTPPEESSSSKRKPAKLKRGPTREEIMARKTPMVPRAPIVPIENSFTLPSDTPAQKQKASEHATERYGVYVVETIVPDEHTIQRALINKPKIQVVNEIMLKAVEFTQS